MSYLEELERDGITVLRGVLSGDEVLAILAALNAAFCGAGRESGPIHTANKVLTASRNLIQVWPGALELARTEGLRGPVSDLLGRDCGLVRALYFDKPPERSWSLPWHKDMTIAVRDNRLGGSAFSKPTTKAGIPHVEAPETLLRQMVTARVHLDEVTDENGPLFVIPGSHREGKADCSSASATAFQPIHAAPGDVLLMRPLVTHCSPRSQAGTTRHRRIVHLEFAAQRELSDGYAWYEFHPLEVRCEV